MGTPALGLPVESGTRLWDLFPEVTYSTPARSGRDAGDMAGPDLRGCASRESYL